MSNQDSEFMDYSDNESGVKKASSRKNTGSKRGSKKTSKKGSKKASKKGSKMSRVVDAMELSGGVKSKKGSKRGSKKGPKKGSKKASKKSLSRSVSMIEIEPLPFMEGGGKTKKALPPALKAAQEVNENILKQTGASRSDWFGLITYVNILRKDAKKSVKDEKDFVSVNKKILELFNAELSSKGGSKIAEQIKDLAEEAKKKRTKKK